MAELVGEANEVVGGLARPVLDFVDVANVTPALVFLGLGDGTGDDAPCLRVLSGEVGSKVKTCPKVVARTSGNGAAGAREVENSRVAIFGNGEGNGWAWLPEVRPRMGGGDKAAAACCENVMLNWLPISKWVRVLRAASCSGVAAGVGFWTHRSKAE